MSGILIDVYPVWSTIAGGDYVPWKEIDRVCSYFPKNVIWTEAFKKGKWDGVFHLYKDGRFPTGLLSLVRKVLDSFNLPYTIRPKFQWPVKQYDWVLNPDIEIKERHQQALNAVLKNKRGMLQLPTRFGKTTVIASASIVAFGVPTLFIAHQLDLIYSAKTILEHFIPNCGEIGLIGDSYCSYGPITVACIDSLASRLNEYKMQTYLREKVKYVIVDETQFFGPGEYKKVLYECNAPHRIFMSATPERTDGADLELQAASGRIIFSLTEREMISEGYISDVNLEFIPFDHKLYNENDKGINYPEFYTACIVDNAERNALIIKETKELLSAGHPTLIIVLRVEHGKLLQEMLVNEGIRAEFVWGEVKPKTRIELRNRFNAGEIDVLIGNVVFDTAIDLPRASGLILAASGSSKIRAPQRVGRVLSQVMGKVAYVKDIKDLNVKYFSEDAKERQRIYIGRYGDTRVSIRGADGELSEVDKIMGINYTKMFDNLR